LKTFAITVAAVIVGALAASYLTNNVGVVRRFVNGI
jgi:hypothetical protein